MDPAIKWALGAAHRRQLRQLARKAKRDDNNVKYREKEKRRVRDSLAKFGLSYSVYEWGGEA